MAQRRAVALVDGPALRKASDAIPAHRCAASRADGWCPLDEAPGLEMRRAEMVWALLQACGIASMVRVVAPRAASAKELTAFHDAEYVDALCRWKELGQAALEAFNLVDDAAPCDFVAQHAAWVAGASLVAAEELCEGRADVAINWSGGRHHAQRRRASGFCYANDVVLAAQVLQRHFGKVLCVDVDVHHGDGTEAAFLHSNKVFACSFHQFEPGFFPGTGDPAERGRGRGEGFTLNVGFRSGADGAEFVQSFESHLRRVAADFGPGAVVLVCGADALARDPRGGLRLQVADLVECVRLVRDVAREADAALLVLGGGGYCFPDTARCWARATAVLAGREGEVPEDVPEHEFFESYGPSWSM